MKGLNVIIEKPICLSYSQVLEIVEIAKVKKCYVYAGHVVRFDLRSMYIREKIKKDKTLYVSLIRNFQKSAHFVYGNYNPLYTALIHDIDLLQYYYGDIRFSEMNIMQNHLYNRKYPDFYSIIAKTTCGMIISLENNWYIKKGCQFGFENELKIYTESMTIHENNLNSLSVVDEEFSIYPDMYFWPSIDGKIHGALLRMLEHYKNCIEKGEESNILPMDSILHVYKLIDEIESNCGR